MRAPAEPVRSFVALPCPPGLRAAIAAAPWRDVAAPVRWTDPDQVHLTLRFLGTATPGSLARLDAELARAAAASPWLTLTAGLTGAFPGWRRPRVLWLGVDDGAPLARLAAAVEAAARAVGFAGEERPFAAHVTLGRVRDPRGIGPAVAAVRGWRAPARPETVRELVLYRSAPGPDYTPLARYVLAGEAAE